MITCIMATKADVARCASLTLVRDEILLSSTAPGSNIGPAVDSAAKTLKDQGFTVPRSLVDEVKAGADALARQGGYGSAEALRRYSELY